MDARVLVLVFDLAAAVLHAHVHAKEHMALVGGERVAQAAERDSEVLYEPLADVEWLVA